MLAGVEPLSALQHIARIYPCLAIALRCLSLERT